MEIIKKIGKEVYIYRQSNRNHFFYKGYLFGNRIVKLERIKLEEFIKGITSNEKDEL